MSQPSTALCEPNEQARPVARGIPHEAGTLLLVSFLVSFANLISHGQYFGPALGCLAVALGALAWSFVADLRAPAAATTPKERPSAGLLWAALASMPITGLLDPKVVWHPHTSLWLVRALQVGSLLLLGTYLPFLTSRHEPQALRRARFVVFGALVLVMGLVVIRVSPAPFIDVWDLQMRGAKALLRGENPYVSVTAPITCSEWEKKGFTENPYCYFPGALYVGVIGLLAGNDIRYSMLLAVIAAGAALRAIARSPQQGEEPRASIVEDAPALFLWLTPSLPFIVELAWVDPVPLACVCIAVAFYLGGHVALCAAAIGLALVSKQPMVWILPLAGVAFRFRLRDWILAAGICAVLIAPFAFANFDALKYGTFDFQRMLPPRDDSLGAAVWCKQVLGRTLPVSVAFLLAALVVGAAALRARAMKPPGETAQRALFFARAATLTYFTFFFFSARAFANFYFLVAGLASLAAAAALHRA